MEKAELEKVSKKIIILSFDGGGSRMILQYAVIKRLLLAEPSLLENTFMFAGTSAGSMLAVLLATKTIEENDSIITWENIQRIFHRSLSRKIFTLNGLLASKYSNTNLEELLNTHLGNSTIDTVENKLFIPTFDVIGRNVTKRQDKTGPKWLNPRVKRWHPVYYHNLDDETESNKLKNIIMESSAAPFYFPLVNGYVDGGMAANNPSLAALSKLLSLGYDAKNIYILSIGSGEKPTVMSIGEDQPAGGIRWASNILRVIFDASSEVTSQTAYEILGDRFWRIQPVLTRDIRLDDTSIIAYRELMKSVEKFDMSNTLRWLKDVLSKA